MKVQVSTKHRGQGFVVDIETSKQKTQFVDTLVRHLSSQEFDFAVVESNGNSKTFHTLSELVAFLAED